MSLLHGAKKHFILAVVFVLSILGVLNKTITVYATTIVKDEKNALAKIVVGRLYDCIDAYQNGWSIDSSDNINKVIDGRFYNGGFGNIGADPENENVAAWVISDFAGRQISDGGDVQCSTGYLFKDSLNYLHYLDTGEKDLNYWDTVKVDFLKKIFTFAYLNNNTMSDDDIQNYFYQTSNYKLREKNFNYGTSVSDQALYENSGDLGKNFQELTEWMRAHFNLTMFAGSSSYSVSDAERYWITWHAVNGYVTGNNGKLLCPSTSTNEDFNLLANSNYDSFQGVNRETGQPETCYIKEWDSKNDNVKAIYAMSNGDPEVIMDKDPGNDIRNILTNTYGEATANVTEQIEEAKKEKEKAEKEAKKANADISKESCRNTYVDWYNAASKTLSEHGIDKDAPELKWSTIPTPVFLRGIKENDYTYMPTYVVSQSGKASITYWTGEILWGTPKNNGQAQDKSVYGVTPYVKNLQSPLDTDKYRDSNASDGAEPCYLSALVELYFKPQIDDYVSQIKQQQARQDAAERTKNFKNGCVGLYKEWLLSIFEFNGANEMEYFGTPGGSYGTQYTAKAKEIRETINNAIQKVFGQAPTSWNDHSNWYEYVFVAPGTQKGIMRDWDNDNKNRAPDMASGGTGGTCLSCDYIRMSQEALRKYAPEIQFAAAEECKNPTVDDFDSNNDEDWSVPEFGDWTDGIKYIDPPTYEDPTQFDDTNFGQGANYEPDTCYAGSGSLGWILCPLIAGASSVGEELWDQIETYHLKLPANALFGSIGGTGESGIHIAWSKIRDIANIVFVIVLLIIVLSQVTGAGISNYGIKKMLPKLLVCIVFVNLSYILCQIAVDISNTIGSSIGNFLQDIARQIPWTIADVSNNSDGGLLSGGFITILLIGGAAGGIFALIAGMKNGNGAGSLIGGLGLLVLGIVIIILVAIITLYVTLMIREAAVVVCIAIAPLAIVCNVLPNTQPLFKKWFNLMKALLVLYPVSSFMVGGGQLAGAILASTGLNTMRLAAGVVQVIPYFFVPTLLRKSLAGLGNIGAKIGGLGKGLGRKASHGATGAIRNSRRYQDMLKNSSARAADRYEKGAKKRRNKRIEALNKRQGRDRRFFGRSDTNAHELARLNEMNLKNEAQDIAALTAYGGAKQDEHGNIIRDARGRVITNAALAQKTTAGSLLERKISAAKEAGDSINKAEHANTLYTASMNKTAVDREIQTRTAEAYAMDYDEQGRPVYDDNGNVIQDRDPATGQMKARQAAYTSASYNANYRQSQDSKLNGTLASGYVARPAVSLAGAMETARNTASNEIGKAAEADYTEQQKATLIASADNMSKNIGVNYKNAGEMEKIEAAIKVLSNRGGEDKAIDTYRNTLSSLRTAYDNAGTQEEKDSIVKVADSFKQKMTGSSIKAISIHAKQTEGESTQTVTNSDGTQTTSISDNFELDNFLQGDKFKQYLDQKGSSLTLDKDTIKYMAGPKNGPVTANMVPLHILEQMSASGQPAAAIENLGKMMQAQIDAAGGAPVFGENLSPEQILKFDAKTIGVMASSAGDIPAIKSSLQKMTTEQRAKLKESQIQAIQKIDPTFMANANPNPQPNNNNGGNAGNNGNGGSYNDNRYDAPYNTGYDGDNTTTFD